MTEQEEIIQTFEEIAAKHLNEIRQRRKELDLSIKKLKKKSLIISICGVVWCGACCVWNNYDIFYSGKTFTIALLMLNSMSLGMNLNQLIKNIFERNAMKNYESDITN